MIGVSFPRLAARDLDGREVTLPAGLPGERNVVLIAFRRGQQKLADSWVPWLEQRAATDPRLRFVELPAIGPQWEPARPFIDGGMAAAIRDQAARRRTLTVYTDVRRVTVPLGIDDRSTIWLFLVDLAGRVAWRGSVAGTKASPPPSARRWPPHRSRPLLQPGRRPSSSIWRSTRGSGCRWPRPRWEPGCWLATR